MRRGPPTHLPADPSRRRGRGPMSSRAAAAAHIRSLVAAAEPRDAARLEARIDRAVKACGCASGATAMLLAIMGAFAWWLTVGGAHWILWRQLGIAALAIIVATLAGKLGGLAFAHAWLWMTRHRLERLLATAQPAGQK
jgi:hypothetical protein